MSGETTKPIVTLPTPKSPPRIAVIGDIMIDEDIHCTSNRACQEGPWPVLLRHRSESRMGGAGNVAEMLFALGAQCLLCGLVGEEDWKTLPAQGQTRGFCRAPGWTTKKTRFFVDGKLTGPRLDEDMQQQTCLQELVVYIHVLELLNPDAIIVSDHGKGVVTHRVMQILADKKCPIFIDPVKSTPVIGKFGCWVGGSNEFPEALHEPQTLITKHGAGGLTWMDKSSRWLGQMASHCKKEVDPLGAGDQLISALAYARCLGADWPDAITWANIAAGMQCERPGCIPLTVEEINGRAKEALKAA